MNEVKRIHLGRQQFTIAIDAQKELHNYLDAIAKQVDSGSDVIEEVELRMAELLTERGITRDKVILAKDVAFLKEQLGEPSEFADDADKAREADLANEPADRRLYRDTQTGWLGGVAAGLASYTGLPVLLVRLAFVVLTFVWGASILIYILLWLILPDAKTPSDRLRMQGKPVTVDTLREFVESSGISDNAHEIGGRAAEAGTAVGRAAGEIGRVILVIVGIWLIVVSICAIIGLLGSGSYLLFHPQGLFAGVTLFPVGAAEKGLLAVAIITLVLLMVLLSIVGISLVKKRWVLPIWVTICLAVLIIVGSVVSGVGGAAVASRVQDRYNASRVEVVRNVPKFKSIDGGNLDNADVSFVQSATYNVTFIAYGNVNQSALKASVNNGELHISTNNYRRSATCQGICIPMGTLQVIVASPTAITPINWPKPPIFRAFPLPKQYYFAPAAPSPSVNL